jgi:hypothetical protein
MMRLDNVAGFLNRKAENMKNLKSKLKVKTVNYFRTGHLTGILKLRPLCLLCPLC